MESWIVLPDMQVPYHDVKTLRAVERFMGAHRWDGYLNLGDLCDFNEISSYNEGAPGRITERVDQTFAAVNGILDRHQRIIRARNQKARFVLIEGNHDYRAVAYREKHPELGKTLDVPRNLRLKERGFEWVPAWSKGKLFKLGNAHFTHGLIVRDHHSKAMVQRYGVSIYYGHTHDVQEYPLVLRGADKTIVGKSLGCLCRYDQAYTKGAPTNWQQAFAVFHILPDGFYTEHTIRIFRHRFVGPDRKVYDGRVASE